jgi:hypothetical protein
VKIDLTNLPNNIPPAFRPILTWRGQYLVCWGGAGSGKSVTVAKKLVARALMNPQHKFLCCRKNLSSVEKSVAALFEEIFHEWGIPFRKRMKPFITYTLPGGGRLVCAGFDDPEKLKSVPGITGAWFEEATEFEQADFLQANLRMRGDTPSYKQFALTFNPVLRSNWVYPELFAEHPEVAEAKEKVAIREHSGAEIMFHHSTYRDNPYLDAEYTQVLAGLAKSSDLYYTVYEKGLWGRLAGTIYYSYGAHNIAPDLDYADGVPILWGHDFNIGEGKPMSSVICQRATVRDDPEDPKKSRDVLHVLDEIILDGTDTHDAVAEFRNRRPGQRDVIIYGDAAGRARDTRSKTTDYQIIADAGFPRQDVPRANPPVRERHNQMNAMLKAADGTVSLFIHPRCKTLLRGLETVKLKPGAQYVETETREQHVTTALGYLVTRLFPARRYVKSGKKHWK